PGQRRDAFGRPFVADHGRCEQSGLAQSFDLVLALGDENKAAGAGAHDRWPIVDHAAIAGTEDIGSVYFAVGAKLFARALLDRRNVCLQLVTVLLIEQRSVGQRVVEYARELIAAAE